MDPIIERLYDRHGGRILDVATGHGDFLKLLTESFADYDEAVGIDPAEDRLEAARKLGLRDARFVAMSAEQIDYPDNYFDTVAIRHSLHHLNKPEKVLRESVRVLKPGGLFILCEVFQSPGTELPNSQRHLHHFWAAVDRWQGKPHYDTLTPQQILNLVEALDLNIDESFGCEDIGDNREQAEALNDMLAYSRNVLTDLKARNGPQDLIARGEELIEIFERDGYTDERAIYIFARK
ncbi:MAG: methyltransferase domain-containing protein [bacterium]